MAVVDGATQPGGKTMLCPNGPRLDQREITRMMSLLTHLRHGVLS
jgi:hypothetical protein